MQLAANEGWRAQTPENDLSTRRSLGPFWPAITGAAAGGLLGAGRGVDKGVLYGAECEGLGDRHTNRGRQQGCAQHDGRNHAGLVDAARDVAFRRVRLVAVRAAGALGDSAIKPSMNCAAPPTTGPPMVPVTLRR